MIILLEIVCPKGKTVPNTTCQRVLALRHIILNLDLRLPPNVCFEKRVLNKKARPEKTDNHCNSKTEQLLYLILLKTHLVYSML